MAAAIIDTVTGLLILGMTYALMSEGLWGAALMFFNVLFASMVTLNCYEPLAQVIGTNVSFMSGYADALCILLIFTVTLLILRLITENLAPSMVRFPKIVYQLGRVIFAFGGAVLTMGVLMLSLDASPVDKRILGAMDHKYQPFFKMRLDKEVLAIFQYSTGQIFSRAGSRDPYGEYGNVRVFDPRGVWLLNAQEARPYGTQSILGGDDAAAPAADGAAPGGATPGQAENSPRVPGGTAGAAVGLAPTN